MNNTKEILKFLKTKYPDAKCSLHYKNPLQLLIATILSAQCTDIRVNIVCETLFKKYQTAADFANANEVELQNDVRSTGFYRNKAKNIIGTCQKILTDFDREVPKTMKELISLPGVARKTGNVVLGNAFKISDGIVVDTHVSRLSTRFGWTKEKNAEKIEKDLVKIIPKEEWINISHRLILFGREVCNARKPNCEGCKLESLCPSAHTEVKNKR